MVYIVLAMIIATTALALYAIIISGKHSAVTFILIPLFLGTAFYTWKVVDYYRGMPVQPVPLAEEVQVVHVQVQKPWILLLLLEQDRAVPRYFIMPYTKKNEEQSQGVKQANKRGEIVKGFFRNTGEREDFKFERLIPDLESKTPSDNQTVTEPRLGGF